MLASFAVAGAALAGGQVHGLRATSLEGTA
jgi:hypothetical protein